MSSLLGVIASGGRGVCPSCGGGSSKERSLRAWEYNGILYGKCYRNSCGRSFRSVAGAHIEQPQRERHVIQYRTHVDCPKSTQVLARTAGLAGAPRPCSVQGREGVVYDLKGAEGSLKGWSVRFYDGRYPKSLNVYADTAPGKREIGWFCNTRQAPEKPLLVVEDCLSAVLASKHLPCVALCGTVLTFDNFYDILSREGIDFNGEVIFALDKDAYTRALMYGQQFSSLCKTQTLNLDRDIKDMSDEAIRELLGGFCGD